MKLGRSSWLESERQLRDMVDRVGDELAQKSASKVRDHRAAAPHAGNAKQLRRNYPQLGALLSAWPTLAAEPRLLRSALLLFAGLPDAASTALHHQQLLSSDAKLGFLLEAAPRLVAHDTAAPALLRSVFHCLTDQQHDHLPLHALASLYQEPGRPRFACFAVPFIDELDAWLLDAVERCTNNNDDDDDDDELLPPLLRCFVSDALAVSARLPLPAAEAYHFRSQIVATLLSHVPQLPSLLPLLLDCTAKARLSYLDHSENNETATTKKKTADKQLDAYVDWCTGQLVSVASAARRPDTIALLAQLIVEPVLACCSEQPTRLAAATAGVRLSTRLRWLERLCRAQPTSRAAVGGCLAVQRALGYLLLVCAADESSAVTSLLHSFRPWISDASTKRALLFPLLFAQAYRCDRRAAELVPLCSSDDGVVVAAPARSDAGFFPYLEILTAGCDDAATLAASTAAQLFPQQQHHVDLLALYRYAPLWRHHDVAVRRDSMRVAEQHCDRLQAHFYELLPLLVHCFAVDSDVHVQAHCFAAMLGLLRPNEPDAARVLALLHTCERLAVSPALRPVVVDRLCRVAVKHARLAVWLVDRLFDDYARCRDSNDTPLLLAVTGSVRRLCKLLPQHGIKLVAIVRDAVALPGDDAAAAARGVDALRHLCLHGALEARNVFDWLLPLLGAAPLPAVVVRAVARLVAAIDVAAACDFDQRPDDVEWFNAVVDRLWSFVDGHRARESAAAAAALTALGHLAKFRVLGGDRPALSWVIDVACATATDDACCAAAQQLLAVLAASELESLRFRMAAVRVDDKPDRRQQQRGQQQQDRRSSSSDECVARWRSIVKQQTSDVAPASLRSAWAAARCLVPDASAAPAVLPLDGQDSAPLEVPTQTEAALRLVRSLVSMREGSAAFSLPLQPALAAHAWTAAWQTVVPALVETEKRQCLAASAGNVDVVALDRVLTRLIDELTAVHRATQDPEPLLALGALYSGVPEQLLAPFAALSSSLHLWRIVRYLLDQLRTGAARPTVCLALGLLLPYAPSSPSASDPASGVSVVELAELLQLCDDKDRRRDRFGHGGYALGLLLAGWTAAPAALVERCADWLLQQPAPSVGGALALAHLAGVYERSGQHARLAGVYERLLALCSDGVRRSLAGVVLALASVAVRLRRLQRLPDEAVWRLFAVYKQLLSSDAASKHDRAAAYVAAAALTHGLVAAGFAFSAGFVAKLAALLVQRSRCCDQSPESRCGAIVAVAALLAGPSPFVVPPSSSVHQRLAQHAAAALPSCIDDEAPLLGCLDELLAGLDGVSPPCARAAIWSIGLLCQRRAVPASSSSLTAAAKTAKKRPAHDVLLAQLPTTAVVRQICSLDGDFAVLRRLPAETLTTLAPEHWQALMRERSTRDVVVFAVQLMQLTGRRTGKLVGLGVDLALGWLHADQFACLDTDSQRILLSRAVPLLCASIPAASLLTVVAALPLPDLASDTFASHAAAVRALLSASQSSSSSRVVDSLLLRWLEQLDRSFVGHSQDVQLFAKLLAALPAAQLQSQLAAATPLRLLLACELVGARLLPVSALFSCRLFVIQQRSSAATRAAPVHGLVADALQRALNRALPSTADAQRLDWLASTLQLVHNASSDGDAARRTAAVSLLVDCTVAFFSPGLAPVCRFFLRPPCSSALLYASSDMPDLRISFHRHGFF